MGHPCRDVLVIEEDGDLLAAIAEFLEEEGVACRRCASAAEAAAHAARADPPDLILVDLTMGELSGSSLIGGLRASPGWGKVPIAAMSGHPLRRFAYVPPVDAFLEKPFDLDRLNEVLRHLCGQAASNA